MYFLAVSRAWLLAGAFKIFVEIMGNKMSKWVKGSSIRRNESLDKN